MFSCQDSTFSTFIKGQKELTQIWKTPETNKGTVIVLNVV